MNALIDAAFARSRVVMLMLAFVLVAGTLAWQAIPKESEPDIAIPIIYVSMTHEGQHEHDHPAASEGGVDERVHERFFAAESRMASTADSSTGSTSWPSVTKP